MVTKLNFKMSKGGVTDGSVVKNPPANAENTSSILGRKIPHTDHEAAKSLHNF